MTGGVNRYQITGTAGGMQANCYVSMVEYNYLTDYSFEEGGTGWTWTDLGKADELYVEDKLTDSLTGSKHMHFWSAAQNSVHFTLEQTVTDLPEGKFRFAASIMGGDAGEHEVYAYVKADGEIVATAPMTMVSRKMVRMERILSEIMPHMGMITMFIAEMVALITPMKDAEKPWVCR